MIRRLWKWFWAPTARYAWGTIILVGFAGGIIFFGSFNAAMKVTNTTEFCISCHEMEQTVYQEYLESSHYRNASGVRTECADCHVPDDFVPKLIRKIQASREVWGAITGIIDTPEEFEAQRWVMANRVWAEMEANDSRECRSCHSEDAMDFDEQTRRAAKKMRQGVEDGDTCIDCHRGVAHQMPVDPNAPIGDD